MADADNQADLLAAGARLMPSYLATHLLGLQAQGQQIENSGAQLKNEETAAALAEQRQYLDDVQRHFGANPSTEGAAYMAARYPKQHDAIKAAAALMQDGHIRRELTSMGEVWQTVRTALKEKDPKKRESSLDIARNIVRSRIAADLKAGQPADDDQHALELLESGDPESLSTVAGMAGQAIAALRPENYAATLKAQGEELRSDQTHPLEVEIKTAEAENAPGYYGGRARNENAQADVNTAEAGAAPEYYASRARYEERRPVRAARAPAKPAGPPKSENALFTDIQRRFNAGEPVTDRERQFAHDYQRRHGGREPQPKGRRARGGPVVVKSAAEARALPQGTIFILDGKVLKKK